MKRSATEFTKGFSKPSIELVKQPKKKVEKSVDELGIHAAQIVQSGLPNVLPSLPKLPEEKMPEPKLPETKMPKLKDLTFLYDSQRDDSFYAIQKYCKGPKPLMIVGPAGSGKTFLVQYYADAEFYDDQDPTDFLALVGLRKRGPCVFDPVDGLERNEKALIKRTLENPDKYRQIILIGEDKFSEPLKSWTKYCNVVVLESPSKSFVRQVLMKHNHEKNDTIDTIIENCRGNLGHAIHSLRIRKFSEADAPMDVFKATRLMTQGLKVQCLGGSADASFLTSLMQLNSFQVCKDTKLLSKKMEIFSMLDILDSRHILDGESTWDILSRIGGPQTTTWKFEWPKSIAPKKNPWFNERNII